MASGHQPVPQKQAEQMAAPTSTASTSRIPLPTGSRPQMATSGCAQYRLATPEPPPGADIRERTSALLDFRRLFPQVRTLWMAVPIVRT